MFKSIQTKIMFYFLSVAASLLILTGGFLVYYYQTTVEKLETANLKNRVALEATYIKEHWITPGTVQEERTLLKLLPKDGGANFFLINSEGRGTNGKKVPGGYKLNFSGASSIQRIYKDGTYQISSIAKIKGINSEQSWFLVKEEKESKIYAKVNNAKTFVILFIVAVLFGIWIIAKRISFDIQRPLKALAVAAEEIAQGNINRNLPTGEGGELAGIADSFNIMLDKLKSTMQKSLQKSGEATYMQDIMDYVSKSYDELPGGIISINNVGDITTFNTTAAHLTGLSSDILGRNIQNPMPPEIKILVDSLRRCLSSGRLQVQKMADIRNVSGERIPVIYSSNIHFGMDNEVIGAICVFKRVEDIKRFEESANRSRNLEYLGEMATSLAHEIKNPLTSIRGYTQYINKELSSRNFHLDELDIILYETDRLTSMLDTFLKFARPESPAKTATDLRDILDYVVKLVSEDLPDNITIEKDYEEIPEVMIDSSQIEAVILNLLLNAIQAMPNGGPIFLRTRYENIRSMVRIEIQDSGSGIPRDMAAKVFQPFFTTKEGGTGLGLPICSRIIENHNGILELESIYGEMTKFSLLFQAINTR